VHRNSISILYSLLVIFCLAGASPALGEATAVPDNIRLTVRGSQDHPDHSWRPTCPSHPKVEYAIPPERSLTARRYARETG